MNDVFKDIDTLASMFEGAGISEPAKIKLSLIDLDPNQPRKYFDAKKLTDLEISIRANGVIQPIIVKKLNDRFLLVAGERRVRAATAIGLEKIPAVLGTTEFDADETLIVQFTENYGRVDFTIDEELSVVNKLLVKYKIANDVAEKLGVSKSWVSKRLKILNAGESVKLLVKSGLTRDIEGLYQLSVLEKKMPDKIVNFVDSCLESGCVPQNFRYIKEQLSPSALNKPSDSNQTQEFDKPQARKIDKTETMIDCTEIINYDDGILLSCQQSTFILPRHVVDMIISHETK